MDNYMFDVSTSNLNDADRSELDQELIEQLHERGRMFSSTPLINISYSRSKLRYFSTLLSKDVSIHDSENSKMVSYTCDIKFLKSQIEDLHPLKISVRKTRSNDEGKATAVYNSVFFSWKNERNGENGCLNLPFLFCVGQQKFVNLVNSLLENYFSCVISPIVLPQLEFKWLVVLIVHYVADTLEKDVHFVYEMRAPDQIKLDFLIPFTTLKTLWNDINGDKSSKINQENVARMHTAFEEHIIQTYGYDLSDFNLKMFNVPKNMTLDVSGKVHVSSLPLVDLFCKFLKDRVLP